MSFLTSIVDTVQPEIDQLLTLVSGEASQTQPQTAYEIEGALWESLLALG